MKETHMHADAAATAAEINLTAFIERRGLNAYTDSRAIAHLFGKRHDNVLQSIQKNLRSKNPVIAEFARLNFQECSYDDRGRPMRMFRMTAKGMAELTMGFTGEKATELRIRFVEAFDEVLKRVQTEGRELWEQVHEARRDSRASEEKGRIGSMLMHERKREKPGHEERLETLMSMLQLKLFPG